MGFWGKVIQLRFLVAVALVLTPAFAADPVPAPSQAVAPTPAGPPGPEVTLSVKGVKDFFHYSRLKTKIQDRLKSSQSLQEIEERRLARGNVVLVLHAVSGKDTSKFVSEVKSAISGADLDPGRISVVEVDDEWIKAEIR